MSEKTNLRSPPGIGRIVSGLFAGAWQLELVALLAILAVGFGIGILLNSFLLGFLVVLVVAIVVLIILSVVSPPSSRRRNTESTAAHQLQHEAEHPHAHSSAR